MNGGTVSTAIQQYVYQTKKLRWKEIFFWDVLIMGL